ncbi:MAG: Response regulator MprA [Planctomycetes bacterium ADurb.Bin126]|nr:MAG: Response regulator MprA [Planctomycetes bacterium ADurb.Bin126]HOD82938.1 response regulator [Phycisphaerae bacterium]HQL73059.1 response regulator [Phycisphaerae bacterium]
MTSDEKKTILLADDDVDYLLQTRVRLEGAGYAVIAVEGQAQAEKVLANTRPDLAVVDLMMEHTDAGFALCHHIKKKDPGIPVILVTGVASETGLEFDSSTREERSWVKADALLAKPVRFEQLQAQIEHLLKEKR